MLANPVAAADLEHVIGEFINASDIFTALHVTVELREKQSPAGILRHMSEIAPEVRNAYRNGNMPGYQSSLDPSGSFNIYYPQGSNPQAANLVIKSIPRPLKPSQVLPQGIPGKRVSAGNSTGYPTQVTAPVAAPVAVPAVSIPAGFFRTRSDGVMVGGTPPATPVAPTVAPVAPPVTHAGRSIRTLTGGASAVRGWRRGGYVETPREMLRQAGLTKGTVVLVSKDSQGNVTIAASSNGNGQVQNRRHCLRLHKNLLGTLLPVLGSKGVQFTYDNGTITLSAA